MLRSASLRRKRGKIQYMRKRLIFLYRYITAPHRIQRWLNPQTLFVLLMAVVFIAVLAWTTALSETQRQERAAQNALQTAEALSTNPNLTPVPTSTPLSEEYLTNSNMTIGITIVGVFLVIIVILGMVVYLPRISEDS